MIKKGFLLALFAIGVFANIFAQDTLSFKKTRDKNIYIEFLGASNLIGVSFDSRFTRLCQNADTAFFYAQSPDFLKPGLCYYPKFSYL